MWTFRQLSEYFAFIYTEVHLLVLLFFFSTGVKVCLLDRVYVAKVCSPVLYDAWKG